MRSAIARAAAVCALAAAATTASPPPSWAVLDIDQPWNPCTDAYLLKNIAFDARMTAIMMYYKGLIETTADPARRACLTARVLRDEARAVIDRTMGLVDGECMPIEAAARRATERVCP